MIDPIKPVRKEAVWVMTKITTGTPKQISEFFKSSPFRERLVAAIINDHVDVKNFLLNKLNKTNRYKEKQYWYFRIQ